MRGRISHLSTLAKRFAAVMRRCDVETFLNAGRIYAEIAPMEKRIDIHIDLLKREEFRTLECVSDVTKLVFISPFLFFLFVLFLELMVRVQDPRAIRTSRRNVLLRRRLRPR